MVTTKHLTSDACITSLTSCVNNVRAPFFYTTIYTYPTFTTRYWQSINTQQQAGE